MIIKNFYAQLHKYIQQILTKLQGETSSKTKIYSILFIFIDLSLKDRIELTTL